MIHSMTGFGRAEKTSGSWRCGVEVRSVNSRFLEVRFKLPGGLYHHEDVLKKVVRKYCERGKLDCTLTVTPQNHEGGGLALNEALLQQYARLLHTFQEALGAEIQVTLGNLTNIKDLILTDQWAEETGEVEALMTETLSHAVQELEAMREREGSALLAELTERVRTIRAIAGEVGPLAQEIPEQQARRLRENLNKLMAPGQPTEERILQEIAILADRYDSSEEISRLDTHLAHLEQMLEQGGAVGRKVDFLLQEINREANTLAAKSGDVTISRHVVDIKSELEKLREQIQNVE